MDTISNMFVTIKNAQAIRKAEILIPFSKIKIAILSILKENGYIKEIKEVEKDGKKMIKAAINYEESGKPSINKIIRVSKPGRRIYIKTSQIPKVLNGFGIAILSTPKGIMSGNQAKKDGIGGELIAEIY